MLHNDNNSILGTTISIGGEESKIYLTYVCGRPISISLDPEPPTVLKPYGQLNSQVRTY